MTADEIEKIKGECDRCRLRDTALNYLMLKSSIKTTVLHMCSKCYNEARQLWSEFFNGSSVPDRSMESPRDEVLNSALEPRPGRRT